MTTQNSVTVTNQKGLHARAAAKLVALAEKFESEIEIGFQGQFVSAFSIMGLMMFGAAIGSQLDIKAHGVDEACAVEAIQQLFSERFGEEI